MAGPLVDLETPARSTTRRRQAAALRVACGALVADLSCLSRSRGPDAPRLRRPSGDACALRFAALAGPHGSGAPAGDACALRCAALAGRGPLGRSVDARQIREPTAAERPPFGSPSALGSRICRPSTDRGPRRPTAPAPLRGRLRAALAGADDSGAPPGTPARSAALRLPGGAPWEDLTTPARSANRRPRSGRPLGRLRRSVHESVAPRQIGGPDHPRLRRPSGDACALRCAPLRSAALRLPRAPSPPAAQVPALRAPPRSTPRHLPRRSPTFARFPAPPRSAPKHNAPAEQARPGRWTRFLFDALRRRGGGPPGSGACAGRPGPRAGGRARG